MRSSGRWAGGRKSGQGGNGLHPWSGHPQIVLGGQGHGAVEPGGVEEQLRETEQPRVGDELQLRVIAERQHRAGLAAGELFGLVGGGERDVGPAEQRLEREQVQAAVAGNDGKHIAGLLLTDLSDQLILLPW